MCKTRLFFIRHAEPMPGDYDSELRPLSPKGMEDRKLVTRFLEPAGVERVFSSPYPRAVLTVEDFALKHGLEIEIMDDLRERRVGRALKGGDFAAFCKNQWADPGFKLPGGDSLKEVQSRNVSAVMEIIERHPGVTAAVGSHGTALSTIVNRFCPAFGYEEFLRIQMLMPWAVRLDFDGNDCVGVRSYDLFKNTCKVFK